MRGYWGKPEATAEVFRHGWFHSGDLGVMDADGYLTIVDRKKDLIITGGENVASREVEDAIYEHPSVSEVAVFGVAHPEWIEAVTAAVVLRDDAATTPEEIVAHTRERLAAFKSPKSVVIVAELPKNPSGKILKRELRDTYADLAEQNAALPGSGKQLGADVGGHAEAAGLQIADEARGERVGVRRGDGHELSAPPWGERPDGAGEARADGTHGADGDAEAGGREVRGGRRHGGPHHGVRVGPRPGSGPRRARRSGRSRRRSGRAAPRRGRRVARRCPAPGGGRWGRRGRSPPPRSGRS